MFWQKTQPKRAKGFLSVWPLVNGKILPQQNAWLFENTSIAFCGVQSAPQINIPPPSQSMRTVSWVHLIRNKLEPCWKWTWSFFTFNGWPRLVGQPCYACPCGGGWKTSELRESNASIELACLYICWHTHLYRITLAKLAEKSSSMCR